MTRLDDLDPTGSGEARAHIIAVAADLLAAKGLEALTTRAVAAAARVQAPTIYRLFGDKQGLLDAAAEQGFATYVASKANVTTRPDPLEDFRTGWDRHIAFGLDHPALFTIIAEASRRGLASPAAQAGMTVLRGRIRALAAAGVLRVPEEEAVKLVHAIGTGTVLVLLEDPAENRDAGLALAAREAAIAAITGPAPAFDSTGPEVAAIMLRASLGDVTALSAGEHHLISELLDRIALGGRRVMATSVQEDGDGLHTS